MNAQETWLWWESMIPLENTMRDTAIQFVMIAIHEVMHIEPELLPLNTTIDVLGADSLEVVSIMQHIESNFKGYEFNVNLSKIKDVNDIVEIVEQGLCFQYSQVTISKYGFAL